MATKSDSSRNSFFFIINIGEKYNINIHRTLLYPWPKYVWNQAMANQFWMNKLITTAIQKDTLAWIILDPSWIAQPQPLWLVCKGKPFQLEANTIRVLFLEDAPHFIHGCLKIPMEVKGKTSSICIQRMEVGHSHLNIRYAPLSLMTSYMPAWMGRGI